MSIGLDIGRSPRKFRNSGRDQFAIATMPTLTSVLASNTNAVLLFDIICPPPGWAGQAKMLTIFVSHLLQQTLLWTLENLVFSHIFQLFRDYT